MELNFIVNLPLAKYRNLNSKENLVLVGMPSTEYAWEFQNNALWDTF